MMASTLVESLPCEHFLATYSHGLFSPVGQSSEALFERLLRLGVTQHYGIVSGDIRDSLADLAGMLGFEYHQV
jgi:L-arabinose isomerase